jgi:hypothetical protein
MSTQSPSSSAQTADSQRVDEAGESPPSMMAGVQLNDPQVRALRIAVIVMGFLIVAGLIALIGRIIYIVARPSTQIAAQSASIAPEVRASLPAGAVVRTIALQGDRLAIHYEEPAGSGIAIVDLSTGRMSSRVVLVPDLPKQ